MPVKKLTDVSPLSDPTAATAPLLKGISGRKGTTQPLTERSYNILKERLSKQAQYFSQSDPLKGGKLKLGGLLDRAKIPRAIALKMTDLTESYSQQMWALVEAALSIERDEDEPYGPELEGVLEKSRAMAERFQQALEEIEECYALLRQESRQVVMDAVNAIVSMNTDVPTKLQLLEALFNRYNVDYRWLVDSNGVVNNYEATPRQTLLPLLKGKNVYKNKENTLGYLFKFTTKTNQSSKRASGGTTNKGTAIQMLYQVQPKFETSVFSDHAGFVAKISCKGWRPLFVYYHSLEHGHQHTNTRTAWNYGSHSSLNLAVQGSGTLDPEDSPRLAIHNHREAYLKNLMDELNVLMKLARDEQGNVLVVIGECTLAIHEGVLDLVLQYAQSPTDWTKISRISENSINVHGAKTQAPDYDLKVVNASKTEIKKGKVVPGLGVHALMGYLFLSTKNSTPGVSLEASLLTLKDNTRQNLLTLKYGPHGELHALTHLLNGKEDALAGELKACGYASVGGDLNNLTVGTALVETIDRNGTHISMGSNSTATEMYDKIVLL
jgi:hypothetical protein